MPDRLPPLNALRAFEAVARHGSVKKAAAELFVTPAAVTHQIKLLESIAGRQLLVRKPRSIELTEAARAALPHLAAGFAQLALAVRDLRESRAASTLTVSVAPSFATCWLTPRLHRFITAQPEIDVRVTARTRQSTVVAGQSVREAGAWLADADVAVLLSAGDFPGFRSERLLDLNIAPVASPKLVGRRRMTPADLRNFTLMDDEMGRLYDGNDFWSLWLAAAGASRLKLRHGSKFSHTMMALEAAVEGVGVLCTTLELARPQLESKRLVAPFELRLPLSYGYYLILPEKSRARAPAMAFIDWLKSEAKS